MHDSHMFLLLSRCLPVRPSAHLGRTGPDQACDPCSHLVQLAPRSSTYLSLRSANIMADRSRSPPLHAHAQGDNKAWSNFGVKIFVTTPVYVTPTSIRFAGVDFANRSIAGPGPAAGPAGPAGPAPAGPAGPGALEAAAASPGAGPNVQERQHVEAAAAGPGAGEAAAAGRV